MKSKLAFLLSPLLAFLPAFRLSADSSQTLQDTLPSVLQSSKLPSIAAVALNRDTILETAAAGRRKADDPTLISLEDKFHLGSCTKSMTATLAAILVESGQIHWTSTVEEILGESIPDIHPDFHEATLEQLLAHTAGLPGNPPRLVWMQAWADQGKRTPTEQRLRFVSALLRKKPDYRPGSKTVYSNQGYATAGLMLETVANTPWETLLADKIFAPLEMTTAGFRAPGSPELLDQPWGHRNGSPVPPGPQADNPDAIGPAATVHASIGDWAKFAQYHLRQTPAPLLNNPESLEKLHSLLPNSDSHGVGGWLVHDIPQFGGHCIQMVGSNTMWMALMWILPEKDLAVLVTTNDGGPKAFPALDQVTAFLIEKHSAPANQ